MNRTILKLFTQACYHGEYDPENVPNDVVEKFAELIVLECAGICENHKGMNDKYFIADAINKHFGVE
jgi:hypothetical protein